MEEEKEEEENEVEEEEEYELREDTDEENAKVEDKVINGMNGEVEKARGRDRREGGGGD